MNQSPVAVADGAPLAQSLKVRSYRYLRLLLRTWWILLLTVGAAVCWQAYVIYGERPQYQSVSRMWVSGKVALPSDAGFREELQNFFGTQSELLRSELLKRRTADRIRLLKPNLSPVPVDLKVGQLPRTAVFLFSATSTEPAYTQEFLQKHMEEYLLYKKELRQASAEEAMTSIKSQVYGPEKELKEAEEKMLTYKADNSVVFLQDVGSSASSFVGKYTADLAALRTQLQLLELLCTDQSDQNAAKLLESSAGKAGGPKLDTAASTGFQKSKEMVDMLKAERDDWGRFLKPKHPRIAKMDEEIARQERLAEVFRRQSREALINERDSLKLQVQNLSAQVKEWEEKAQKANRTMAAYEQLKVNADRLKDQYNQLLKMGQNVNTGKNLDQENVSVMENASRAEPIKSTVIKRMILAFLGGLAFGLAIIWFVDRQDDRISALTDLMHQFDLPTMGAIPQIKTGRNGVELVHAQDKRHSFVESFRDIRSALLFSTPKGVVPRTLLVTSAVPTEGKSSISSNLAVTLALSGSRVLLVDADLRCGTIHRIFGVAAEPGLSEVLSDQVHFSEVIKQTASPNLSLISSGKSSLIAGELFLHTNTQKFLDEVSSQYDFVVIDSAPVLATSDTTSLAPKVDGVLLVVRSGFTSARLCKSAIDLLRQRQVNLLGFILNRADLRSPGYYQYKYSKYYSSANA